MDEARAGCASGSGIVEAGCLSGNGVVVEDSVPSVPVCNSCEITFFEGIRMSDEEIWDFFVRHGVLREVTRCTRCDNKVRLNRNSFEFRCQRSVSIRKQKARSCGFKKSFRTGTFLERSKLSPRQVLDFVNVLAWHPPPRLEYIQINIGISSGSVVNCYHSCREVFVDHSLKVSEAIGGPGCTVEIYEAKVGSKYYRCREIQGQWVYGGVQRGKAKSFMVPVKSRDAETLLTILSQWVLPGSTVYSNCWKAYECLNKEGFARLSVDHSLTLKKPRSNELRFNVRNGKAIFVGYFAEFQFNSRYPTKSERLHQFFSAAAALYPPPQ